MNQQQVNKLELFLEEMEMQIGIPYSGKEITTNTSIDEIIEFIYEDFKEYPSLLDGLNLYFDSEDVTELNECNKRTFIEVLKNDFR